MAGDMADVSSKEIIITYVRLKQEAGYRNKMKTNSYKLQKPNESPKYIRDISSTQDVKEINA